jgi:RNA polymerase sigma factor (sigma-70 family)
MIELLKEIRKKDKNAVTLLYNRYGQKLYGYAVKKWNLDEDEAWELVYKTLYKIMEVADRYKFEDEKKFAGFIFMSFVNNLRNYYNEKKKKQEETVELPAKIENYAAVSQPEEETQAPESEHMQQLQKVMAGLEDWQRILLLMRAQDFSYEEIAKYVHKPAGQLKVYYLRLKKHVTTKINERITNK